MKTATRWLPVGLVAFVIFALPDPALAHSELASPQPRSPGPKQPQPGWTPGQGGDPGTTSDGCGFSEVPRTSLTLALNMVSAHAMANFQLMTEADDDIIFADGFDCVDDQGCGEPVCVNTSACTFDSVCDETGTRMQRCTPQVCSRGSCVQGTDYMQTVACFRITDGEVCGVTTVGCPAGSFRELCCSAAPVSTCTAPCGACE